VVRQRVIQRARQKVIERGDETASVQIAHILGNNNQPVLFRVAEGVHSPEQAGFFLSQFGVLSGEVDAFLKADARPFVRIEYSHPILHKDGLQKHLSCVLHMKQVRCVFPTALSLG
jgi:hypothetical protein